MAYIGKIEKPDELIRATDDVLNDLKDVIVNHMDIDTAKKLLFWLNTWSNRYLLQEKDFDYLSLMKYERGMVVEANLGFKVGSEQGGLHFAVVLDNDNAKSNKTMVVIPLRSLKDHEDPNNLPDCEVFLGYDIFKNEIELLRQKIERNKKIRKKMIENNEDVNQIDKKIKKDEKALEKYCRGSIALVNQICALSKLRIYAPKYSGDVLSSVKLDNETMKKIEDKIQEMYLTKPEQKVLTNIQV